MKNQTTQYQLFAPAFAKTGMTPGKQDQAYKNYSYRQQNAAVHQVSGSLALNPLSLPDFEQMLLQAFSARRLPETKDPRQALGKADTFAVIAGKDDQFEHRATSFLNEFWA